MTYKCQNCGMELNDQDNFCFICGYSVDFKAREAEKRAAEKARRKKKIRIAAGLTAAAAIIGADTWGVSYILGRHSGFGSFPLSETVSEYTQTSADSEKINTEGEEDVNQPARLLKEDPTASVSNYSAVSVSSASATSQISQKNTDNGPMMIFDGQEDTSWQEGVKGWGIGETVSCSFRTGHYVKYIACKLGNWRNDQWFAENGVPKTMTLEIGSLTTQITFSGEKKVEWVELKDPVYADGIRFTIDDVYEGTDWDDTCITDITIYGR